jgi:hypothetical protein
MYVQYVCMYVCFYCLSVCLSVCLCVYVCMYVCIHVYLHFCMNECMYVCMYVCMRVYISYDSHTYIRTSPYGWSRGQLPPQQCSGQREVAGVGPPRVRRHHQSSHSGPRTASLTCSYSMYVCTYVSMYVCNLCMDPM